MKQTPLNQTFFMGKNYAQPTVNGIDIISSEGHFLSSFENLYIRAQHEQVGNPISIFVKGRWTNLRVNKTGGSAFPESYHIAMQLLQDHYPNHKEMVRDLILAIAAKYHYEHGETAIQSWEMACHHYFLDTGEAVS